MVNLADIHYLAKKIAKANRAYCDGQRPLSRMFRLGLSDEEIKARSLPVRMVELEFCDDLGNEFTKLVPEPVGDPLDIFTTTLRKLTELAKNHLAAAISAVVTIAKLIFEVESKRADNLPPPKTTDTMKLGVAATLSHRLIPAPILNRA